MIFLDRVLYSLIPIKHANWLFLDPIPLLTHYIKQPLNSFKDCFSESELLRFEVLIGLNFYEGVKF